ncbi:recombination associated protein RdgC [Nitrosomonas cryotolerans]|uniref:Recombination-associated protein RdgC n=1 Tax=Nitrosomonas cryotolerans ATCC 49181 TaxID=1131553 RepID=A0A1N6FQ45_9PROT|nr:recombination-associated protein RdgC [Nitrosomonas cryotolerans]SFP94480.1 recombination associated protein RdgC [Nitrosomonas cryotolerans]SIN97445.1 recombination associated protein RdgC [Nitrosomonas cryotolerans ATCC 49181]
MWFRNLQVYRMTNWNMTVAMLEETLSRHALQGCLRTEMQSRGWVSPREDGESFVHVFGQHMLIAFGVEKKLLPAAVINQFAKERIVEIEQQQGYKPGRKQIKDIKEAILLDLLPRAFTLRHKSYAWINPTDGCFIIDTPSTAKADELIEMLLKSIDSIGLTPLKTKISPSSAMTEWLSGDNELAAFSIDRDCELRGMDDEKATVNYIRHVLDSEDIAKHVKTGKQVTKLAMTWRNKISFILHDNLQFKRIAPLDILKEPTDTTAELFDSDFAIMTGEITQLLPDMIDVLGGEEHSQ